MFESAEALCLRACRVDTIPHILIYMNIKPLTYPSPTPGSLNFSLVRAATPPPPESSFDVLKFTPFLMHIVLHLGNRNQGFCLPKTLAKLPQNNIRI